MPVRFEDSWSLTLALYDIPAQLKLASVSQSRLTLYPGFDVSVPQEDSSRQGNHHSFPCEKPTVKGILHFHFYGVQEIIGVIWFVVKDR